MRGISIKINLRGVGMGGGGYISIAVLDFNID